MTRVMGIKEGGEAPCCGLRNPIGSRLELLPESSPKPPVH